MVGSIVGSLRFISIDFSPGGKYAYLLCYDAFFALGTYEFFIIPFKATSEQVAEPVDRVVEAVNYADTDTYADSYPGPNEASEPVEAQHLNAE